MRRLAVLAVTALIFFFLFEDGTSYAYKSERKVEILRNWRTIETEHFRIAYHEELESLALKLSRISEQVYSELTPLLQYKTDVKTEIMLTDHVDQPNGWANVYPYNHMVLYAVPPDRKSVLNDYDDWLRLLFVHEETHIIQLDTKSGLPAAINLIFGGLVHPNQYMPTWYTEGIGVFNESRFTAGGRARSSMFEMFLRADAWEGEFLEIDQIQGGISRWPRGHISYLYGSKFLQYLGDKYGEETFAALGYLYGQRIIPLALNTVLKKVTDDDFIRLYEEWKLQMIERTAGDVRRLEVLGLTQLHYVTDGGENHDYPALFPTGDRILYYHDDAKPYRRGWAELDIETGEHHVLLEATDDGGAAIAPDGRRIVTAQLSYTDQDFHHFDLYLHDLDNDETRRLTEGVRAREPAFAPDGRRLAFVQYTPGASHLMIMDIDRDTAWEPFPQETFDQVFSPTWSPDGRFLAFTAWRFNSFKDIYLYDLENNRLTPITTDRYQDLSPAWSSDGRKLFWSNDRTGIYNIYSFDLETGFIHQLSNVVGGLFSPLATPDGKRLYVASYRSHGFDLAWIDLDLERPRPVPTGLQMRPAIDYKPPDISYQESEYSPFPSLAPKIWLPTWGEDHAGMTLGIRTWGDDITNRHSWSAEFDVGLKSGAPTIALSYSNRTFIPTISLRAAHASYTLIDAASIDGQPADQNESRTSGSFSLSFPFRNREVKGKESRPYSHRLSLSASFKYTRLLDRYVYSPTQIPAITANTGLGTALSLGWTYNKRQSFPGYIATAAGRSIFINVRADTDLLGSDYNSITVSAGYSEYIANPWVDNQCLALKFTGGFGASDQQNRQTFYLGGPPDTDIISDIVRNNRTYGSYLRGYEPLSMSGDKYLMLKTEYRFIAWNIERGLYTLPLFFRRVHMAPFFDIGYAWNNEFNPDKIRKGLGGEIRLDIVAGYFTPITISMGYQYGFDEHGVSALYFMLDNVF